MSDPSDPRRVFILAGAGASYCEPAGLPLFQPMRDALLYQLDLRDYLCPTGDDHPTGNDPEGAQRRDARRRVLSRLTPEPFLQQLQRAGAEVERWLGETLDRGEPNAVHVALAELAATGAKVWTVNFDRLIEASNPDLKVYARHAQLDDTPDAGPGPGPALLKPHGTLGSPLIFTAVDVLRPLPEPWRERLLADTAACDTIVFLGYSAGDLDLRPWLARVTAGKTVRWFTMPDSAEHERLRRLLHRDRDDPTLHFHPPEHTDGANPARDFVDWCTGNGLVHELDPQLVHDLQPPRSRELKDFPVLAGNRKAGRAAVQTVLGDAVGARASYLRHVRPTRQGMRALLGYVNVRLNYAGPRTAQVLATVRFLPTTGPPRIAKLRSYLLRKCVTQLSNAGEHGRVLAVSDQIQDPPSTVVALRVQALRMTGRLEDAIAEGWRVLNASDEENQHEIGSGNAALQLCWALTWAGRPEDAWRVVDDELRPKAGNAATRWIAWADLLAGLLHIWDRDADAALGCIDLAEDRFTAEQLMAGVVAATTARLTALRLAGEPEEWRAVRRRLDPEHPGSEPQARYVQSHPFTVATVQLEDAEFAAHHDHDLDTALRLYQKASTNSNPLQAALGHLGIARHHPDPMARRHAAAQAATLADRVSAITVADLARAAATPGTESAGELFFP